MEYLVDRLRVMQAYMDEVVRGGTCKYLATKVYPTEC
jgi:hypothetical protein